MYDQIIFEMKNGQIKLELEDYWLALGVQGIVTCGNKNEHEAHQIVPFKTIRLTIHPSRWKLNSPSEWEEIFFDAWQELSD